MNSSAAFALLAWCEGYPLYQVTKKIEILLNERWFLEMIRTLIYCASGAGERVAYSLDDTVYQIVGLVDSNPEVWGKPLYG